MNGKGEAYLLCDNL